MQKYWQIGATSESCNPNSNPTSADGYERADGKWENLKAPLQSKLHPPFAEERVCLVFATTGVYSSDT